jgi:sarcosine oxidase
VHNNPGKTFEPKQAVNGARFDVIVVGVGTMGAATCHHLAARGVRVLGLEQYGSPHHLGSHGGRTRALRYGYAEHPDYVTLVQRAAEQWRSVERAAGRTLFSKTGALIVAEPGRPMFDDTLHSLELHQIPHEVLGPDDLEARFPQFHLPPEKQGVLDFQAGFLRPERCIEALIELALRKGATIQTYEPVVDWQSDGSGVKVTTSRGTYAADRLIFAAGAGTDALVRDLGVDLVVSRQVQAWFRPTQAEMFQPGVFPIWVVEPKGDRYIYGFPIADDDFAVKVADDSRLHHTTLETVSRTPTVADAEYLRREFSRILPEAAGTLLTMQVCLYTNTPDLNFILDFHPAHGNVVLGCGFSGHGFKFAPVVGEVLSDLALQGRTTLPVDFLRLSRFE